MVNIGELIDKANVKEYIAITGGLVLSRVVDAFTANMDAKQRDIAKAVGGLVATYLLNEMSERYPEYSEMLQLAGLATTAMGATPVANRISVQVSKFVGAPVVIAKQAEVKKESTPSPCAAKATKASVMSI